MMRNSRYKDKCQNMVVMRKAFGFLFSLFQNMSIKSINGYTVIRAGPYHDSSLDYSIMYLSTKRFPRNPTIRVSIHPRRSNGGIPAVANGQVLGHWKTLRAIASSKAPRQCPRCPPGTAIFERAFEIFDRELKDEWEDDAFEA